MGWFDLLACFPCSRTSSPSSESETDVLIAPGRLRAQSILSQDGYGTMSMSSTVTASQNRARSSSNATSPPRFSNQQRERMAEISRAAGSHMRPIGSYALGNGRNAWHTSPMLRSVSHSSSRGSSPSPPRPLSSPPGGVIGGAKLRTVSDASQDSQYTDITASTHSDLTLSSSSRSSPEPVMDANGVVRKSIFGDGAPVARRRTSSGSRPASGRRKRIS